MKRLSIALAAIVMLAACGPSARTTRTVSVMPSSVPEESIGTTLPDPPTSRQISAAARALEQWRDLAVTSYSFRYQRSCFCESLDGVVTVTEGRVTAWEPTPDPYSPSTGQPRTIEELLALALRAEVEATGPFEISFDPVTGVPMNADIDWMKGAIDDEMSWRVSDFRRLGLP